jgi:anaerobic selenocysteine-containing dehydrogenase
VTGDLDRPGGAIVAPSPIPAVFLKRTDTYGARRTRVGGYPDAFGMMRSAVLGKEMLTPGPGQLRAFFTVAGNPLHQHPEGVVSAAHQWTGHLRTRVRHKTRKVKLDPPGIIQELSALGTRPAYMRNKRYPPRMIDLREPRSHNSRTHNSPKLMAGKRDDTARIHPRDAASEIGDGDLIRITSKTGSIDLPARLTDEIIEGTIAVPHGRGHAGGWRTARATPGANVTLLASSEIVDIESLAGMTVLDGISVRIDAVAASAGTHTAPQSGLRRVARRSLANVRAAALSINQEKR